MLKNSLKVALVLLLLANVALLITMLPQTLDVPPLPAEVSMPAVINSPVQIAAIPAGKLTTLPAFGYRGGSLIKLRDFNMGGILITHPQGDFLLDTGFGADYREHDKSSPLLMRLSSWVSADTTVAKELNRVGYDRSRLQGILLTHAHWDHVSGIPDLLPMPVWVNPAEYDFIHSGHAMGALMASFGDVQYQQYAFDDGPYLGFTQSNDLFGDGSVVLVPAAGHTPGSVIVFVHTRDQQSYAFIGDIAWQAEGVQRPAERPWLSRKLVDLHEDDNRKMLLKVAALQRAFPALQVVPAHDTASWASLPRLDDLLK